MQAAANEETPKPAHKWGFLSSTGAILAVVVAGGIAGELLGRWPPMRGLLRAIGAFSGHGRFEGSVLGAMVLRDWLFLAFLIAAVSVAWMHRAGIVRFFRAMQTGVMLVTLSTLAVSVGVLVPQIENFEDPEERVTVSNRAKELEKFLWAEGYFLFHLTHLYGIGMPPAELPENAVKGLERFGRIYGAEEEKNRRVMMESAQAGQQTTLAIEQFIKRHKQGLTRAFDVCTALQLNRTYKSSWFATLMWMLGAGVLVNTFRYSPRVWFTAEKAGFIVTHAGMLLLLGGGLVSNLFTDRGILELRLGEPPEDTYYRHYRMDKRMRMPFSVQLERFARKEWKAIDVHFLQENFTSRAPRYTVWPGRRIPLDWQPGADGELAPQMELVVREVHDHARVGEVKINEGTAQDGGPALAVAQFDAPGKGGHSEHDGHGHPPGEVPDRTTLAMAPEFNSEPWIDPAGKFRLAAVHGAEPSTAFPVEGDDAIGTLYVDAMVTGGANSVPHRIQVGDRVEVGGGFTIEVLAATRDFKPEHDSPNVLPGDPRPLAEQPDGFRAVWLAITPAGGGAPERRVVSEVIDPIEYGLQEGYKYRDLVVRLRWDRWTEAGAPRYAFAWTGTQAGRLLSQGGQEVAVAIGDELDLPGDTSLVLKGLYEYARPEIELAFETPRVDPDGFDPSFYERDARGIVLDVVHKPGTPEATTETLRLATIPRSSVDYWKSSDGRVVVEFLENLEGFPFDWRSVLRIVEKDAEGRPYVVDTGTPKQREIRVNDYFKYKGYRFFQTNANPKDPAYSGIGVVYDPGIEIVLAGMYTIIAGTVLAFLVRPIVRARRRAEVSA